MTGVVSNNPEYLADMAVVGTNDVGEIEPRNGSRRHRPRRRNCPISTIDQPHRGVRKAGWLYLRECGRGSDGRELPSPRAAVITHPVDIQMVVTGVGADLKIHRVAGIHADIGRKSLNITISGSGNVPTGIPWKHVFTRDRIPARLGASKSGDRRRAKNH